VLKSLVLGTILGGLLAFLWSFISWELLPWHEKPLNTFLNNDEVSAVILSHTTKSGVYLLPGASTDGMTAEQKKAAEAVVMKKMQKGPVVFAAIRREGFGSFARGLITQYLILTTAAFLLTWLVMQTSELSYAKRVIFLAVVGLSASVIADLPNWNWWGFSTPYTAVMMADYALTWLLAGSVIAKVAKGRAAA
jgi:hypothetical protein